MDLVKIQPENNNNNNLTMSSLEIAELTGKRHDHVIRDIENMLNDLEIPLPKFGGSYIGKDNTKRKCYNLPKNITLTLISGYNTRMRHNIINRWMELENGVQKKLPSPKTNIKSLVLDVQRLTNLYLKLPCYDKQTAVLKACETLKNQGIDAGQVLGITHIESIPQSIFLTPTEIGKKIGLSAQKVNKNLIENGFLKRIKCALVPVQKYKKYCKIFETNKRNSDGIVQQIKWSDAIISMINWSK